MSILMWIRESPNGAAIKWWEEFIYHRTKIFPHSITDSFTPVKVAVIDTGIDTTNPWLKANWRKDCIHTPDGGFRDFLKDNDTAAQLVPNDYGYEEGDVRSIIGSLDKERRDEPIDLAGHGTHLAGIVLQLTPDATLYVGRVLEMNEESYDAGAAARRVALVSILPLSEPAILWTEGINATDR